MTQKDEVENSEPNKELIATMPKDQLRSLFYLFAGKPDSRIKVFTEPVHLCKEDIVELNNCIIRKLKTHNIEALIPSIKIGYVGADISEFGTWTEFETHHWQEPEQIEEIVVKWDFMVNIRDYLTPQRHTLLFRVSTELKPGKIFQLLASGNSDEFDQVDMFASPAFCRVDFINAQISKELVYSIDDWYKGREAPVLVHQVLFWFKKRRRLIAELLDHWFYLSWVLLLAAIFYFASNKLFYHNVPVDFAVIVLLISFSSLRPMSRIGMILAGRVFRRLDDIEGSRVVFEFTSGDKKRIAELREKNRSNGYRFVIDAALNISLNIIASLICVHLFSNG